MTLAYFNIFLSQQKYVISYQDHCFHCHYMLIIVRKAHNHLFAGFVKSEFDFR